MDRNRKDLVTSLTSSEWEEEEEVVEVDNKPERLNHLFIRLMLHWRICTMAKISSSPSNVAENVQLAKELVAQTLQQFKLAQVAKAEE